MMSQDTRTRPPEPDSHESLDALDDASGGGSVAATDVLERLWRFFISMRTGLWLILALGLMSLIGALLLQVPAGLSADPAAYAAWLATANAKYGGWTMVFDKLGFFGIFTSIEFKTVMVLLTTSVLSCSVHRAPRLWKLARHPRIRMGETFYAHAPLRAAILVPAGTETALQDVQEVLKAHGFRTLIDEDEDEDSRNLYADRFRWGPFGTVIAHLSFVVILLGFMVSAVTGYRNTNFVVPVGSTVAVGNGSGLSVKAMSFNDAYYEDGTPSDYASDLVLSKYGVQVDRQTIRVNNPLKYQGYSFYQSFFGEAVAMKVLDPAGKVLYNDAAALSWSSDDGNRSIGQFNMPAKKLVIELVVPASGKTVPTIKAGQVEVNVFQDGIKNSIASQVIDPGKPVTLAGLSYTFERTRQFTGLIVAKDPGMNIVWLGSFLLVLGLYLVFFFPHRRLWVRIRKTTGGSEILAASTLKRDPAFKPQFNQLITDIQLAGTPESTPQEVGQNDA